jgi:acrylyl-CoA reductase (NADPH)
LGRLRDAARVKADWLVPLPEGLDTRAMAVGTAGLTAMLAVIALERHGLVPRAGAGAGDGARGRRRVRRGGGAGPARARGRMRSPGGRSRPDYLRGLGAAEILDRAEFAEVTKKPLESERWAGCVDAVAGVMLGRVLKQMKYGASVAAIGLAGGAAIEGALITPFILRGVNLLGIDSVMRPMPTGSRPGRGSRGTCRWSGSRRWWRRRRWPICRSSGARS